MARLLPFLLLAFPFVLVFVLLLLPNPTHALGESFRLKGKLLHCAWQFETSYERCNMGVIDQTARYTGGAIFPNHRVYKWAGRFPTQGHYFSITLYDDSGIHILGSFPDFALVPSRGKNPYREKIESEAEVGDFELHLITDNRSRGYRNEIVLDLWDNLTAIPIVIMREYGLEGTSGRAAPYLPELSYLVEVEAEEGEWEGGREGGKEVVVEEEEGWTKDRREGRREVILDAEGKVQGDKHFFEETKTGRRRRIKKEKWVSIPTCDEDARITQGNSRCRSFTELTWFDPWRGQTESILSRALGCKLGGLALKEGGGEGGKDGGERVWPHMVLKAEGGMSTILGFPPVYTNAFCEYMYWCVSQHHLRMSDGIFITIKGTLPRVSSGLFGGKAPVADVDAYDVRYLSYTVGDLWWPGEVYKTITGLEIERHYTEQRGKEGGKEEEWDRKYTLVTAYDRKFPQHCGFLGQQGDEEGGREDGAMFMPFSDAAHPNGAVNPIIVLREVLPSSVQRAILTDPTQQKNYLNLGGDDAEGSMIKAHKECVLSEDSTLCTSPAFLKASLAPGYYPQIEVWRCDLATGQARKIK